MRPALLLTCAVVLVASEASIEIERSSGGATSATSTASTSGTGGAATASDTSTANAVTVTASSASSSGGNDAGAGEDADTSCGPVLPLDDNGGCHTPEQCPCPPPDAGYERACVGDVDHGDGECGTKTKVHPDAGS